MNSTTTMEQTTASVSTDRRTHKRYRLAAPISVQSGDRPAIPAMTLEISEGGLSAVLAFPVNLGDTVQLGPIAAGMVTAQVRHNVGRIYGFQFLQISEAQIKKLREDCTRLPLFFPNHMSI